MDFNISLFNTKGSLRADWTEVLWGWRKTSSDEQNDPCSKPGLEEGFPSSIFATMWTLQIRLIYCLVLEIRCAFQKNNALQSNNKNRNYYSFCIRAMVKRQNKYIDMVVIVLLRELSPIWMSIISVSICLAFILHSLARKINVCSLLYSVSVCFLYTQTQVLPAWPHTSWGLLCSFYNHWLSSAKILLYYDN